MPSADLFPELEATLRRDGPLAVFDRVASELRVARQYDQILECRLMKARFELGWPLIQTEPIGDQLDDSRRQYEDAYIAACREVGNLLLEVGEIGRAWVYFRAIGEPRPVADAIEKLPADQATPEIIELAFSERVHPVKGFEMLLAHYGTCSAITSFEQYSARDGRDACVRMLVERLHGDLLGSLRNDIQRRDPAADVATSSMATLIAGRDWLFEDNNYHVDTSHLNAVVRYSVDLRDPAVMRLACELAEYGCRLSSLFQYRGQPPFDEPFRDYCVYLKVLVGDEVESGIAHFRKKLNDAVEPEVRSAAAQVLVALLTRLGRAHEALDVSLEFLSDTNGVLACLSVPQICHISTNYQRLREFSQQRGDLVNFTAAIVNLSPSLNNAPTS